MKVPKAVFHLLGILVGSGAALVITGCSPENDAENAKTPATESIGIPDEVSEEVDAISKRLEADALSEAGLRVKSKGKDADTTAAQWFQVLFLRQ